MQTMEGLIMASNKLDEGQGLQDCQADSYVVVRQRRGSKPVVDSYHDSYDEAQAQAFFLRMDPAVDAEIFPPGRRRR